MKNKERKMVNHMIESALQQVIERPEFLDKIDLKYSGKKKIAILKIAETLRKVKRTQCLKFASSEFEKEFGAAKSGKGYFVKTLKLCGIKKPRVVFDNGTCYVWSNDE